MERKDSLKAFYAHFSLDDLLKYYIFEMSGRSELVAKPYNDGDDIRFYDKADGAFKYPILRISRYGWMEIYESFPDRYGYFEVLHSYCPYTETDIYFHNAEGTITGINYMQYLRRIFSEFYSYWDNHRKNAAQVCDLSNSVLDLVGGYKKQEVADD